MTEKGYLGLTGEGEAKERMTIALLKGAYQLSLLREKGEGQERWFEFADKIWMTRITDKVKTLKQLDPDAVVDRLELR